MEWNGLARSPIRATYPASLMRVKCVALPDSELLSCLQAELLVFTDYLLIDGNIVLPLFFFVLFWRKLEPVENSDYGVRFDIELQECKERLKGGRDKTTHHL